MQTFKMKRIGSLTTNLVLEIQYCVPEKGNPYFKGCIVKGNTPKSVTVVTLKLFPDKYLIVSNEVCQEIEMDAMSMDDVYVVVFLSACTRALHVAEDILTLPEKRVKEWNKEKQE
jgi:hypothetical protein